ncbi:NAD(P)-binding domain-containing protein [Tabrizicola sp.]|uniref:NAD(P)-binding domain-containing protein n=1 Tax=Tabrizicola sp. TaxID=2005166 RepID=UPI001A53ABDC|nr:NAD(P)-binding domain-containing protein [Tabrizicola sp.]MBL9073390.1 NAD(P)-binding domain-containing protein [Tabrizicola sp.]
MRVGFLGTGEITAAMVRGLKGQGHRILVSPRNAAMAATLAAEVPEVAIAPNEQVVEGSDVVFLCLLARVAAEVLPSLPFRAGQSVISVMVDAPLATLRTLCAPATDIAITIPLPPITTGGCPLPVYPASPALDALFGEKNLILPQPFEAALNAHLGASALCSPILDQLLTATEWLAGHTGNPAAAEAYIAAMIRGYLPERAAEGDLAEALKKLSTEGGLNATLRAAMAPAKESLRQGLTAFHSRLGLDDPKGRT